jgi:hypothetical protein
MQSASYISAAVATQLAFRFWGNVSVDSAVPTQRFTLDYNIAYCYFLCSGLFWRFHRSVSSGFQHVTILWIIPRPKTDMAETHQNKTMEIKFKTTRNVLAFGL